MRRSIKIGLLELIVCFLLITTLVITPTQKLFKVHASESESSVVVSYTDIFDSYYQSVLSFAEESGKSITCEEFCEKYYLTGLSLPDYTEAVIKALSLDGIELYDSIPNPSSDADYILSACDYKITPASEFRRIPDYSIFDYSVLQEGDIVYETETILFNAGHNAIIYDNNKESEVGNYIQTIEAVGGGVQFGFLDDTRIVDFKIKILRVQTADDDTIATAKYFCLQQIGKPYSLNPFRLNTAMDSDKWYCSELMYAAYNYAGIDIGVKKDQNGNDVSLSLGCIPSDIYNSYNTSEVILGHAETSYFLELQIVDKANGTWTITVRNHTNSAITFEYNEKMCFKGDAQNWTGLKDIQKSEIDVGGTVQIQISENAFATSIAASWIYENIRYVSLAYDLNNNAKTMKTEYVTIDLLA